MKKYPKYKDSGLEWIGEIPLNWEIKKNKFFLKSYDERSNDGREELLSVSEHRGIVPRKSIKTDEDVLTRAESLEGYRKVKVGNLVSNIMLTWKKGLGVSELNGIVSPAYSVFDFVESIPKYYHYLFRTDQYTSEFKRNSTGVIESRLRMYDDSFLRLKSHFPPVQEQQQIVTYLDHKTSLIDQIISGGEKKIELLKEQRTAIINHAVTKGLNPKVKMKDSGVEWIGEIPEGWEIIPLKYIAKITLGKMLTSEDKGGQFLKPYLRSQNVQSEECDLTDVKEMWFSEKELLELKVHRNDLLVNEGGDVGRTSIWSRDDFEVYIQNSVNKVSILNGNPKYYLYHFLFHHKRGYFDGVVSRVSIPHLTKEKLSNIDFISPPLQEQQQIVTYLDQKTNEIDDLISSEQKRIELLKEYRQSLISEVVTGKIRIEK